MFTDKNKPVLLFFEDFAKDSFLPYDRYLKRLIQPLYRMVKNGPKVSGFLVWCQLLVKALEHEGYSVHLNNYSLAFQNPHYPVGLIGYPHLLDSWTLPNPAILGPALFDHPKQAPDLMKEPNNHTYLVTCDWMYNAFAPIYGASKTGKWFAAIDTNEWPDTRLLPKTTDILIYDKIRWNRDTYEPQLLNIIKQYLTRRGLSYEIIRYRHYDHRMYSRLLARSRAMIFLCEHETQGMAYQEALASNLPVLAWDQETWLDPNRPRYSPNPVVASSVPYFSAECGEKFKYIADFPQIFDRFWENLSHYEPRNFVESRLSMQGSANAFMYHYNKLMPTSKKTQTANHKSKQYSNGLHLSS